MFFWVFLQKVHQTASNKASFNFVDCFWSAKFRKDFPNVNYGYSLLK